MNFATDIFPDETIICIALFGPIQNILKLCQTSKRFNNLIRNNHTFWKDKFIRDFGQPDENIISWKLAYKNHGTAFVTGSNIFGELGDNLIRNIPIQLPNIKAKSISCGGSHTMIIDFNDNVWTFGNNEYNQLGLGDGKNRNISTRLLWNQESKAKSISCGYQHSMIIDFNNNVWVFGSNSSGQLGLGDYKDRNIPILLSWDQESQAKSISCGGCHTMIIDFNDNVWSFGHNPSGQLGLGDIKNKNRPTQLLWDNESKAKTIACGGAHTMIIDFNDNIWTFGYNGQGQLGLGNNRNRNIPTLLPNIKAKSVSCGGHHSMIIDLDNNVWSFGYNSYGLLGLGNAIDRNIPTRLSWNQESKAISCGDFHSTIIDFNNNVWVFGSNTEGQLGLGDYFNRNSPTQMPNVKAKSISCERNRTIILSLISQVV